tara:strand:- start:1921 stop:2070 length:150 start_codon:yes stop_codon:yes gene_type:complete
MNTFMFVVGLMIFVLYMWGLLAMINQSHASQSKTSNFKKKVDEAVDDND